MAIVTAVISFGLGALAGMIVMALAVVSSEADKSMDKLRQEEEREQ